MALDYLRDPSAIYRRSFAIIRAETDFATLSADEANIATRVIHACGMTDVAPDLVFHGEVAGATRHALGNRRPVLVDVEMVRAAVAINALPDGVEVRCTLNDPDVRARAQQLGTTRSATAVSLWREHLAGAVVIVGNAPTALFALLEMIDQGGPIPAAVFAFPVGFVGAEEAKAELIANPRSMSFVTLRGRRGGSAIAAAAFNAVLVGARDR